MKALTVHLSGRVRLSCREVANVDFKLCCSQKDGYRGGSSSSEAKIVQFGAERRKIFPSHPAEKGTNELSFFTLEGKIKLILNLGEKTALQSRSYEIHVAVSSLHCVYRKL